MRLIKPDMVLEAEDTEVNKTHKSPGLEDLMFQRGKEELGRRKIKKKQMV